jgi:hypothetical protein
MTCLDISGLVLVQRQFWSNAGTRCTTRYQFPLFAILGRCRHAADSTRLIHLSATLLGPYSVASRKQIIAKWIKLCRFHPVKLRTGCTSRTKLNGFEPSTSGLILDGARRSAASFDVVETRHVHVSCRGNRRIDSLCPRVVSHVLFDDQPCVLDVV